MQWIQGTAQDGRVQDTQTEQIIGCAYRVQNTLGAGFLEQVYEGALEHELIKAGFAVHKQQPINIRYDGVVVGDYVADLVVDQTVLIELKAVDVLTEIHAAQCLNYLKATGMETCPLMNFGKPKLEIRRFSR
jgi:GxxExxY protein